MKKYKYRKKYAKWLLAHMKKGYSYFSFAAIIDIPVYEMDKWVENEEDFHRARHLGAAYVFYYFEKLGMEHFKQQIKNKKFNISIWHNMLMKTIIGQNVLKPNQNSRRTKGATRTIAIHSLLDRLDEVRKNQKLIPKYKEKRLIYSKPKKPILNKQEEKIIEQAKRIAEQTKDNFNYAKPKKTILDKQKTLIK